MAFELISELKSRISKSAAFGIHLPLFERILNSIFIGNKDSHDSKYILENSEHIDSPKMVLKNINCCRILHDIPSDAGTCRLDLVTQTPEQ